MRRTVSGRTQPHAARIGRTTAVSHSVERSRYAIVLHPRGGRVSSARVVIADRKADAKSGHEMTAAKSEAHDPVAARSRQYASARHRPAANSIRAAARGARKGARRADRDARRDPMAPAREGRVRAERRRGWSGRDRRETHRVRLRRAGRPRARRDGTHGGLRWTLPADWPGRRTRPLSS